MNIRLIILDKIYEIYSNEYNLELFNVIKSLVILSVLKILLIKIIFSNLDINYCTDVARD